MGSGLDMVPVDGFQAQPSKGVMMIYGIAPHALHAALQTEGGGRYQEHHRRVPPHADRCS